MMPLQTRIAQRKMPKINEVADQAAAQVTVFSGSLESVEARVATLEGATSSAKSYGGFSQSGQGTSSISSTAVGLTLNTTDQNTGEITLSASIVTVAKTAVFHVTADTYINNSNTSRTEYSCWLEVDSGSGWTEVPQSRFVTYQRGYDSGMSASLSKILSVISGDKFRLRVQRTDGGSSAGYQDADGTRLNFIEIG